MDSPPATAKLRLMCSYGGHIVPRPRSNSLCYLGGDTKILSLDPVTTTTFSSLTALLSSALSVPLPFTLKYLLPPHQDLSSLIPLASDAELLLFLHHLVRLSSSSPTSSRIRLFLFPASIIRHPKTEAWFSDALKSAKIMQKVVLGEAQSESLSGGDLSSGAASSAESMVLGPGSSFGSTSSSASSSYLSSLKAQADDGHGGAYLQDVKVTLPSSESFASDNSVTSAISNLQTSTCQDPVIHASYLENSASSKPLDSESRISRPSSGIQDCKSIPASGCPLSLQLNQLQQQQVQFVQVGANYIPHNPTGVLPISSYYSMCPAQPQQQFHYQPNQLCPVYYMPVGQMAPYNLAAQCGLVNTATAPNHPPMHPNASLIAPQVAYKDATVAPPEPDVASQIYGTGHAHVAMPLPHNENQQQPRGIPQMHHQPQSIPDTSRESANFRNELEDDPACVHIYKSQPPPPSVLLSTRHGLKS